MNNFAQDLILKDLFSSCNKREIIDAPDFVNFFKTYDLTNDTSKDPLSNSTHCKLSDSLIYGKILFYYNDHSHVSDYYYLFSINRKEVLFFKSYPLNFTEAETNLSTLEEIEIYNLEGKMIYDFIIPYFDYERFVIENYQYTSDSIFQKKIYSNSFHKKNTNNNKITTKSILSDYKVNELFKLVDEAKEAISSEKSKKIKEFNRMILKKRNIP